MKTGAFDDTFVQIVEGLEEGEQVLLNPPRITESGSGYQDRSRSSDRFESDQAGAPQPPAGPQPGGPRQPGMGPGPGGRGQGMQGPGGRGPGTGGPGGRRQQQGEGGSGAGGPRAGGGAGRELTPERIEMLMGVITQQDPAKAKELKALQSSDPEKFKEELRNTARSMFSRMRQGGPQGGPGGNAGPRREQNQ